MKRIFQVAVLLLIVLLVALWAFQKKDATNQQDTSLSYQQGVKGLSPLVKDDILRSTNERKLSEKSENPEERLQWEMSQLVNPQTGELPANIRQKSLQFLKDKINADIYQIPFASAGTSATQNTEFTNFGPINIGGRTRALGIDVANEDIILAGGISGGMWKSTNAGGSWVRTTALEDHPAVSFVIQDKRSGKTNEWYYSTGEFRGNSASASGAFYLGNGIYKSVDNGDTWSLINSTAVAGTSGTDVIVESDVFTQIHKLAIDYSEPTGTEIYAAGLSEIIKSTDGFETWSVVLGDVNTGRNFSDVAVTSSGKVYAVIANSSFNGANGVDGFFVSDDGENWTQLDEPENMPSSFIRFEIGIDPSDESRIYFVSNDHLFVYNALANVWSDLSTNIRAISENGDDAGDGHGDQGGYDLYVTVHPDSAEVVFLGGINLTRSTNGFTSDNALQVGGYANDNNPNSFPPYTNHHPDQHWYAFYGSNPNRMLTSNDGGVYRTENNVLSTNQTRAITWEPLNNGYLTTQFYHGNIHQYDIGDQQVVGGMQDNSVWAKFEDNPNEEWQQVSSGDGAFTAITYNALYASTQNGRILRLALEDNIYQSSRNITPTTDNVLFINPYTFNPVQQNQIFSAARGEVFFTHDARTNPNGLEEWNSITGAGLTNIFVSSFGLSHQPEGVLYFGTRVGRIFKVEDVRSLKDQDEAIRLNDDPLPAGNVNDIAVDPNDAERVMIAFSNYEIPSIFISEDGGDNWTDVSGNLEENVDGSGAGPSIRSVRMMPDGTGGYYYFAGTSVGLFMTRTLNGTNTVWEQQGATQIGNVVVSSVQVRPIDGTVLATTHGNGVFKGQYDVAVVPNINYTYADDSSTVTLRGNRSFDATNPLGYQWFVDGSPIDGANESEFVADNGGDYQLQVFNQNEQSGFSNTVSLNLDGLAPEITSIVRANPLGENLTATTAQFTVTFNELVKNVTPESFATAGSAAGVPTIVEETTTGLVYDVTVTNIGGSGELKLVGSSAPQLTDLAGNVFEGIIQSSESYNVIDTTEPTVAITRRNPTEETTNANEVSFTVDFSENVNNVDVLDFVFGTGSPRAEFDTLIALVGTKTFELRVNEIAADGRLSIGFATGQNIQDLAGNAFTGEVVSTEDFLIDNVIASIVEEAVLLSNQIVVDANPSPGVFNVAFPIAFAGKMELQIVDASGRSVQARQIEAYQTGEQVRIDLTTQQDGVYLLRAISSRERATVKLLKQRKQ